MMLKFKRAVYITDSLFSTYGFSPIKAARALRRTPAFMSDLRTFKRMLGNRTDWTFGPMKPMLEERGIPSGASGHYFHQDLLVARRIHKRNPRRHIDVGSRIDGFVAHVASFREIEIVDIRPLDTPIPNVKFLQMDMTDTLGLTELLSATCPACTFLNISVSGRDHAWTRTATKPGLPISCRCLRLGVTYIFRSR